MTGTRQRRRAPGGKKPGSLPPLGPLSGGKLPVFFLPRLVYIMSEPLAGSGGAHGLRSFMCSLMAAKVSSLMTCSTRQASSAAVSRGTPRLARASVRMVWRS